ncbi:DNA polymerase III subunit psi [Candidatus Curculioniphilus buchneri]
MILKQLGIIQWTLRQPEVSREGITVKIPDNIRLLLTSDSFPLLESHPM